MVAILLSRNFCRKYFFLRVNKIISADLQGTNNQYKNNKLKHDGYMQSELVLDNDHISEI